MSHQYKVGDRVRRTDVDVREVLPGTLGTVVRVGSATAVLWDGSFDIADEYAHYSGDNLSRIEPAPAEAAPKLVGSVAHSAESGLGLGLASQEHAARCAAEQASQRPAKFIATPLQSALENQVRNLSMQLGDMRGCYDAIEDENARLRFENADLKRELASLKRRR